MYERDLIDKMVDDINAQISDLQELFAEGKMFVEKYEHEYKKLEIKLSKIKRPRC